MGIFIPSLRRGCCGLVHAQAEPPSLSSTIMRSELPNTDFDLGWTVSPWAFGSSNINARKTVLARTPRVLTDASSGQEHASNRSAQVPQARRWEMKQGARALVAFCHTFSLFFFFFLVFVLWQGWLEHKQPTNKDGTRRLSELSGAFPKRGSLLPRMTPGLYWWKPFLGVWALSPDPARQR